MTRKGDMNCSEKQGSNAGMSPNITANIFRASCMRMGCHSFTSPSWTGDMILPWPCVGTPSEHVFYHIVLFLSNMAILYEKKLATTNKKIGFGIPWGKPPQNPPTFHLEMKIKGKPYNLDFSCFTSKILPVQILELLVLLRVYSLHLSECHNNCLISAEIVGLLQGVGAPEGSEGGSGSLSELGHKDILKLPSSRFSWMMSQIASNDEAVSQPSSELATLMLGLKEVSKPTLWQNIKKIMRQSRGLSFHLFIHFSKQGWSFISFGLPTCILLNQDRKLLNAWEERSNHLGSVSYRLQYSAELLRSPASHRRVPTLLASSHRRQGEGCSAFCSLCLFHWASRVVSPPYLLKPFTLPYGLLLIKEIRVIFPSRQFDLWQWWSLWLTEMMKLTIQIMTFRGRTTQGNWLCLTRYLISLPPRLALYCTRHFTFASPRQSTNNSARTACSWFLSLWVLHSGSEDLLSSAAVLPIQCWEVSLTSSGFVKGLNVLFAGALCTSPMCYVFWQSANPIMRERRNKTGSWPMNKGEHTEEKEIFLEWIWPLPPQ